MTERRVILNRQICHKSMLVTIHKNGTFAALQMLEYSRNFEYVYA